MDEISDSLFDKLEERYNDVNVINDLLNDEGFFLKKPKNTKQSIKDYSKEEMFIGSLFIPSFDKDKIYKEAKYLLFVKAEIGFCEIATGRCFNSIKEGDNIYVDNLSKYKYNEETVKKYIEVYQNDNFLNNLIDNEYEKYKSVKKISEIINKKRRRVQ